MDESNDSNHSNDSDDYVRKFIDYSTPYVQTLNKPNKFNSLQDNACPLNRSDSLREVLLEAPTAEGIQNRIETIKDISGQFIEDVNAILEKCGSSNYVIMVLSELVRESKTIEN